MTLKEQLKKKGKSIRSVANDLKLNHSTVIQILQGKYQGSEDTIRKVLKHISFILIDKEDLNSIIYSDPDLFIRAFSFAMRSFKNFTDDESITLVDLTLKLKKFKKFIEEEKLNKESLIKNENR